MLRSSSAGSSGPVWNLTVAMDAREPGISSGLQPIYIYMCVCMHACLQGCMYVCMFVCKNHIIIVIVISFVICICSRKQSIHIYSETQGAAWLQFYCSRCFDPSWEIMFGTCLFSNRLITSNHRFVIDGLLLHVVGRKSHSSSRSTTSSCADLSEVVASRKPWWLRVWLWKTSKPLSSIDTFQRTQ